MRPFRLLSIRPSLYGGWYVRAGWSRRLVHFNLFSGWL